MVQKHRAISITMSTSNHNVMMAVMQDLFNVSIVLLKQNGYLVLLSELHFGGRYVSCQSPFCI